MADQGSQIRAADRRMVTIADPIGQFLTDGFHLLGLFAIGAATVWAAGAAFLAMIQKGHASIEDLLLLFIYLEIGSMVGIYFRTNHMPVRFLLSTPEQNCIVFRSKNASIMPTRMASSMGSSRGRLGSDRRTTGRRCCVVSAACFD